MSDVNETVSPEEEEIVGVPLSPESPIPDPDLTYSRVVIRNRVVYGVKPNGSEDVLYSEGKLVTAYEIATTWAYLNDLEVEVEND